MCILKNNFINYISCNKIEKLKTVILVGSNECHIRVNSKLHFKLFYCLCLGNIILYTCTKNLYDVFFYGTCCNV